VRQEQLESQIKDRLEEMPVEDQRKYTEVGSTPEGVSDTGSRPTQAEQLIKLTEEMTLFHDELDEAYSTIRVNGHVEILRCRARSFRRYLAYRFYQVHQKPPSNEALNSALNVAEAKAVFDGKQHTLHNRVAWHDGTICYDLSDKEWRAVKINTEGWTIAEKAPILFRRFAHQAYQVEPARGGSLDLLDNYLNLKDTTLKLFKIVLCSHLIPDIPHPITDSHGQHGVGKSVTNRIARELVDPSQIPLLSFPRDLTELAQQLSHHYFAPYDNVSLIQPWISDALCRAVTGEGFTKRELYSDDDDVIYKFRRCISLNGINIAATAPDLLDRLILIPMELIEGKNRREEKELWAKFQEEKPRILGAMFDAIAGAMRIKEKIRFSSLPRMADFAVWGEAISQALGYETNDFIQIYEENIKSKNEEVVRSHAVAAAVNEFMAKRDTWDGTATEHNLERVATDLKLDMKDKSWPKAPKAPHVLTRRLKEVISNLRDVGVNVSFDRPDKRMVKLERVPKIASGASEASSANNSKGLDPDATYDATDNTKKYRQDSVGKNLKENQGVVATDATIPTLSDDQEESIQAPWDDISDDPS